MSFETLKPIQPEEIPLWEKIAVILKPEDIAHRNLPPQLLPPDSMLSAGKNTGCRLTIEQNRILGELHIPEKPHQQETHIVFIWWNSNLLFVDPDGEAAQCMARVRKMRPHHADGADDLLMDFYLALIMDDLSHIQNIDRWRLHFLFQEKAVLVNGNALE